jgi:hypothetical protein
MDHRAKCTAQNYKTRRRQWEYVDNLGFDNDFLGAT